MKDVHGWMPAGNKDRLLWLDWGRAAGMLFILFGHAGVSIPFVSRFAVLFYVPVFFVAAGCVYRKREEPYGVFVRRRARRLLLPYFGYSIFLFVFYAAKELLAGSLDPGRALAAFAGILYGRYSIRPPGQGTPEVLMFLWNSPLWFLPALFLSELLFEGIYRRAEKERRKELRVRSFGPGGKRRMWDQKSRLAASLCLCAGTGIMAHYLTPVLLPWSLESIPLFTFLTGLGYLFGTGRKPEQEEGPLPETGREPEEKERPETGRPPAAEHGRPPAAEHGREKEPGAGKRNYGMAVLAALAAFCAWKNGEFNLSVGKWGNSVLFGLAGAACASIFVLNLCRMLENRLRTGRRGPARNRGRAPLPFLTALGQNTMPVLGLHLFVYMWIQGAVECLPAALLSRGWADFMWRMGMALLTAAVIPAGKCCFGRLIRRPERKKQRI